MLVIALGHGDTVGVSKAPVDRRDLAIRLARAFDGEEVEHRRSDEHRTRIHEEQQARVIDASRDHAVGILFGVAVGILEDAVRDAHPERRDVAGRRDALDPRIDRANQRRLEAAAARAGDADARAVDVRPREQVVERTNTVPHFPAREVGAGEIREVAEDRMLAADQVVSALARPRVPELAAFALPDRIPADDDVAASDEALAEGLVVRLAVGRVAARDEDGWMFSGAAVRHVDEGGDEDSRQTLEDELLDMEAVIWMRPVVCGLSGVLCRR